MLPTERVVHFAASNGYYDIVAYLVTHLDMKEVNAANSDGVTAFYRAAASNHVDILRLLKEHGARGDVAAKGTMPIHAAVRYDATGTLDSCWPAKLFKTLISLALLHITAFQCRLKGVIYTPFNSAWQPTKRP